jgi:hypothetical protein
MFVQTVILFLCISIPFFLQAQTRSPDTSQEDYAKFKKTLDKELKELAKDTSLFETKVLHPVVLPDWFFEFPDSDSSFIYSIGISDPGMEEDEAINLAVLRAKCLSFLLLNAEISNVIDNYSMNQQSAKEEAFTTKFVNYFRLEALGMVEKEKFEIVNQYFTSFNEAIVFLKYSVDETLNDKVDSLRVVLDVYQAERQKYNKFEMEEKYEASGILSFNNTDEEFYYSFQSLNNLFEITSRYNAKQLYFPYFHFRYQGQSQDHPIKMNNTISSKLNYGLWKAFLEVFLQEMLMLSQPNTVKVEKVSDDYLLKNQDFTREVFESKPAVKLVNICISNNQLFIELDYLN